MTQHTLLRRRCIVIFLGLCALSSEALAVSGRTDWGAVPEAERGAAYQPRNTRSGVSVVRQALATADPSGARGFEIDADSEALRGTFRIQIPLLNVRGRTSPTQLALHYQARIWFGASEADMSILDGDLLNAPGWSLSIPKILGGVLIEADGTRRPARRTTAVGSAIEDVDVSYVTTDGSNISYRVRLRPAVGGSDPTSAMAEIRYPDGSLTVLAGKAGNNPAGRTSVLYSRLYASAVVDASGNATTYEYMDWGSERQAARPSKMVDPLGREVRFHYNALSQLTAITAPGEGGQPRTLARLTYKPVPAYFFIHPSDPNLDRSWFTFAVEGIFFPATGTGYWFGDTDSYTQYAMLRKVVEQAQMSHSAPSLTEQGMLQPGTPLRTRLYDLPLTAPASGDRTAFPRYTTLTETIAGVAAPLVTRFWVSEQPNGSIMAVTLPDGTRRVTLQDARGLPLQRTVEAADGTLVSDDEFTWAQPPGAAPRLTQLTEMDPLGRRRATAYTFNPRGQLQDVKVYDWVGPAHPTSAPLLRWTRYTYVTDAAYAQRGISDLVSRAETYDGTKLLPEERTDYEYDGVPLVATPGIGRNVFFTPGFLPEIAALFPANASARSGHVTKISRWLEPTIPAVSTVIATQSRYTQAGALSKVTLDGWLLHSMKYSSATEYAFPDEVTVGRFSKKANTYLRSRFQWNLPFGEPSSVRQPSSGETRFGYDNAQRLFSVEDAAGGSRVRSYHADGRSHTDAFSNNGKPLHQVKTDFDARGLPIKFVTSGAGLQPVEALFEYDVRGRIDRMARGHDPGAAANWARFSYDVVGRISAVTMPDGTIEQTSYSRSGAPAQVLSTGTLRRETDALQRSRYIVTDGLNRVVQVLEPSADGSSWLATAYSYDARSNLISIYTDTNRSGPAMAGRRFQYDGLSRLTRRYLVERSATLNAAGNVAAQGLWSDAYWYDGQSNIVRHVDARGVLTQFDYGTDPLRRLQAIRVFVPGTQIEGVPETRFTYTKAGDPMRLARVEIGGILTENYAYDETPSRLREVVTAFSDRPNALIRQRVSRNALGQIDSFSVGVVGQPELTLSYEYDLLGRRIKIRDQDATMGFIVTADIDRAATLERLTCERGGWRAIETFSADVARNRFTRQTLAVQNMQVLDHSFFYDPGEVAAALGSLAFPGRTLTRGQLSGMRDNAADVVSEIEYDMLGRLNRLVSGPTGFRRMRDSFGLEYRYDAAGNRISSSAFQYLPTQVSPGGDELVLSDGTVGGVIGTQPTTSATRDLGDAAADGIRSLLVDELSNRIATSGFSYDAAGNVTRLPRKDGGALSLSYDALGRLHRVERIGENLFEEYRYAPGNQRMITRTSSGVTRYTVWSGPTTSTTFEASGSGPMEFAATTLTLAGRQVARVSGPMANRRVDFLHNTPTARLVSNASQAGASSVGTAPFGSSAAAAASAQFHTYERSPLGLDYAVNRYYDAETARFVQPDPYGEAAYRLTDPQSLNLYTFVRNDPLNRRDPRGLDDCDAGGVASASPDGGITCTYLYPKTVYETVVRAQSGDTRGITNQWLPSNAWYSPGWAPWQTTNPRVTDQDTQDVIDKALGKKLREAREKLEKQERCAAANAAFAAAANTYARVAANVAAHNLTVEALQFSASEVTADSVENYFEQREDFSKKQLGSAVAGRGAAAMSIYKQYQAAKINQALLLADQKAAVESMKSAAATRDAACR